MPRVRNYTITAILLAASALGAQGARGGPAPAGGPPEACETAVLRNGFRLQFTRREAAGAAIRLYVCAEGGSGYVEIPSEQIERFEAAESTIAPPPAHLPKTAPVGLRPAQDPIRNIIASAAARHRIDPDFVASVIKAESAFNPRAVSPKGARGLMQLMPQTAASLGVRNSFDPAANVEGGTKYLRQLLDQYAGDAVKALAAYNAGPLRVEQYGRVPPFPETRAYITRIINDYNWKKLNQQADSRPANQ